MRTTIVCFGALALGMSVIGATSAQAAPPEFADKFDDRFAGPEEFLSDVCGFPVMVDGHVRGTFRVLADGSIHVNERGDIVYSNPENGRTLTNTWRGNIKSHGVETFNEDGTLTIEYEDTVIGMPDRWLDENGKTLIKDTGWANFVGEVLIDLGDDLEDPFDDELLHFHEDVTTHGPHPILEDGLDPLQACDLLG